MRVTFRPPWRAILPVPTFRPRSGSRQSRARTATLFGFAVILAAQIGLGLAVETVKPEWRDPEYGHRIKQLRQLHAEHPDRPLVVAVGSSRTLMGLSPLDTGFADEPGSPLVYNFGQTGAGPLQLLFTVLRILDDGVKPEFLLVELFPAALVGDGPAESLIETWGPRWNAGDLHRLEPYAEDPTRLTRTWASQRVAPWYSLRFPLMNHWQPNWLPMAKRQDFMWKNLDPRGWLAYPTLIVPDVERERLTEKAGESYRKQLANFAVGAMSDRALRDIAARCRREGIKLAFHVMPEGPAFASWYSPGVKDRFRTFAAKLSQETGVPVFDSSEGFAESEFADSHHLLPAGAARFSKKLANEKLRAWLR